VAESTATYARSYLEKLKAGDMEILGMLD